MQSVAVKDKAKKKENRKLQNKVSLPVNILLHFIFGLFAFCCLAPLFLLIAVSLTPETVLLQDGYQFIPRELTLEAYKFLFETPELVINAYALTLFVEVDGTVSCQKITTQ